MATHKFILTSLGCKVNQYEALALGEALARAGLAPAGRGEPCDLIVLATCCVTATAMRKSRQALRRLVRAHPGAGVLVTGCYADYDPDRIRLALAELGLPPERVEIEGHHGDVAAAARRAAARLSGSSRAERPARSEGGPATLARRTRAARDRAPGTRGLGPISRFPARQRAFVKVQDGCDAFCSYCVVPYARCRVWSRPAAEIVAECRRLVEAGHREIVLSGVFLGAYGRPTAVRRRWDDRPSPLPGLIRRVAEVEGLWRLRLSSLEPGDVTDELLDTFRECPVLAPHLHLPLQSGSPRILAAMRRQYTPDDYRRAVAEVREAVHEPAITADVIVGFPGETEADFAKTLALVRQAGLSRVHAFPFSAIEGTGAWRMRGEAPPPPVVRERMARLEALASDLAERFRRRLVGRTLEAVVESRPRDGSARAMSGRYQPVWLDGVRVRPGQIVRAEITGTRGGGWVGQLLPPQ